MDNEATFWLVWNPKRNEWPPSVRHATHTLALQEAMRLARINPGEEFIVLQATDQVQKIDVQVKRLGGSPSGEEMPF